MKIMVFDTETTSLEKPFTYNIGYCIADTDTKAIILRREFVVEQVWHNLELFCSAYYANKREIYVSRMKAQKIKMDKFGYICRQMRSDIKEFEIEHAYAFNAPFDDGVFAFCCDWFKCLNPFDTVKIHDIRVYVHGVLVDIEYERFCEEHQLFTDGGNYSTTAETVYRYISGEIEFDEEHTALADSEIETEILFACIERGADITMDYPVRKSIERVVPQTLTVVDTDGEIHEFEYNTRRNYHKGNKIVLKKVEG